VTNVAQLAQRLNMFTVKNNPVKKQ